MSHPSSVGLRIRAAQPKDAEAVAELINLPGFRWGTLQLPFRTPEHVQARSEASPAGTVSLLAELGEQIVGSASLDRLGGRCGHVGQVGMGVHDAFTGRGIGTSLLAALLDTADNWLALRRIELTVWTDNAPALALYRRCGFTVEGTHVAFAFRAGQYVDAHAMARLRP